MFEQQFGYRTLLCSIKIEFGQTHNRKLMALSAEPAEEFFVFATIAIVPFS